MLNEKDTFKIRNYTTDQTATMFSCKDCIWIDETMENEIAWGKARKRPVIVEFREVIGEKEEIETREGKLYGYAGKDVIIKGVQGEIYPCKKDIFEKTYEVIEEIDRMSKPASSYP